MLGEFDERLRDDAEEDDGVAVPREEVNDPLRHCQVLGARGPDARW